MLFLVDKIKGSINLIKKPWYKKEEKAQKEVDKIINHLTKETNSFDSEGHKMKLYQFGFYTSSPKGFRANSYNYPD